MPRYEFTTGQVLTAGELNDLSDQTVMVFAGTAARGSAIPSPSEGMVTYRSDDDVLEVFDGSVFAPVGVEPAILQVVSTTKTDTFTTTSTTYVDITGFSATITPSSATSKILVMVTLHAVVDANREAEGILLRDSTVLAAGASAGSRTSATFDLNQAFSYTANLIDGKVNNFSMQFLDTPASTSALVYKVQVKRGAAIGASTIAVNRSLADADASALKRTASTITLMEVAG